jgi:hypothetical protein
VRSRVSDKGVESGSAGELKADRLVGLLHDVGGPVDAPHRGRRGHQRAVY